MSNKKAIYTALFGPYDRFYDPEYVNTGYDYYIFTDQPIKSRVYKVVRMEGDARKGREIKLRPHIFLPSYNFTVWHDASIQQTANINGLIRTDNFDIIAMCHPHRTCIYQEANECILRGKDSDRKIADQIEKYKRENYPRNNGLIASGLLFRHNTYKMNLFCEYWFIELQNGSIRDQLSFNYTLWKKPVVVEKIPYEVLKTHFIHRKHIG